MDIYDGLETESYDRHYGDSYLLKRIIRYFKPYAFKMLIIAVLITLDSVAVTASPILIAKAVDIINYNSSLAGIFLLVAGVLFMGSVSWVANFLRRRSTARIIGDVVFRLRNEAFSAVTANDMSFYDEHSSGKIVSRVTADTQGFSTVITLVLDLVGYVLISFLFIIWLLSINAWLTFLLICMIPVSVVIALSFRRLARNVTQKARRVEAKINAKIQESISGIMVSKSFRQERAIYDDFAKNNIQAYAIGIRRGMTFNAIYPIMALASGIGAAILVYTGGLSVHKGEITPGTWYLFMQAVSYFWYPMLNIASFWSLFQDGLSAAERVFALIDAKPGVVQEASEPVEKVAGGITFENVDFSYNGREAVLKNLNLDIRQGETIALVGHTGAGKSSILRLLTRFYEFQGGRILIDGRDIRRLDLEKYRREIGIVSQQPFIFSGSVKDNIRYGQDWASDEDIIKAAKQICSSDWLENLSNGLESDVGEGGAFLSMGQRQLIALTRIVLKNPGIFILDEATANIDPFADMQIQEGLEKIMKGRTSIIVAHRLSTIKHADRIIVIDHGQIIEEGTHGQLLMKNGYYSRLYDKYFKHQSLEYIESFNKNTEIQV